MRILDTCRREGITFGDAYPIIGQVATARVLLSRYLKGEIGEEEWTWRKKERMCTAGPVNLRKYFEEEARDYVGVALGFYQYTLRFLPLGLGATMKPGEEMPAAGAVLTKERFLLRAREVKKQATRYLRSELCLEMGEAVLRRRKRVESAREAAREWREERGGEERLLSPMEEAASGGFVVCNGGSSIGNIDGILPMEYSSGPVRVRLERDATRLRCRPGEFYLGCRTRRGQMEVHVFFDGNVVEEGLAGEWLSEVGRALEFYLA